MMLLDLSGKDCRKHVMWMRLMKRLKMMSLKWVKLMYLSPVNAAAAGICHCEVDEDPEADLEFLDTLLS